MLNEEKRLGDFAAWFWQEPLEQPWVCAHDASGNQVRKSKGILPPDLRVQKLATVRSQKGGKAE
jgi:hypothetical protein